MYRLLSGYSRFPIHEPGNSLAFSGLLLVKKVRTRSRAIFASGSRVYKRSFCQLLTYDPSQCWPVSKFLLSILPEAKPTINCFQALDYLCVARGSLSTPQCPRTESAFSQTGRAHLLLISNTPGISGGAIGVITLEGML
jgi:metal transporter CNNM